MTLHVDTAETKELGCARTWQCLIWQGNTFLASCSFGAALSQSQHNLLVCSAWLLCYEQLVLISDVLLAGTCLLLGL